MTTLNTLIPGDAVTRFIFGDAEGSSYSGGVTWTFMYIFWISTVVFVGLVFLMLLWTFKYRWKPGKRLIRSRAHNTPLEIVWTVIPSIIFVVMFFQGFYAYMRQQIAPGDSTVLSVTGRKWNWDIAYPGGASATESRQQGFAVEGGVPVYYMPEDTPIQLQMSSEDVIHSFWIPDFRFKQDVFPNRYTAYWFQSEKLTPADRDNPDLPYPNREHRLFCAEYCGDNHSEMAGIIRIIPKDEFSKWLANPWPKDMDPTVIGQKLWSIKGCNACHLTDGTDSTGPTWQNLAGYEHDYTNGNRIVADNAHLRESILNPGKDVRIGFVNQMPPYAGRLSEREINALITYINSISDRGVKMEFAPTPDPGTQGQPVEAGAGSGTPTGENPSRSGG